MTLVPLVAGISPFIDASRDGLSLDRRSSGRTGRSDSGTRSISPSRRPFSPRSVRLPGVDVIDLDARIAAMDRWGPWWVSGQVRWGRWRRGGERGDLPQDPEFKAPC